MPYTGECTEMLSVFSHQHFTLSSYYAISKVRNTNFIAHFVFCFVFFPFSAPIIGKGRFLAGTQNRIPFQKVWLL